jgi:hypothetical protein
VWLAYAENTQSAYFVKTGEKWIGSLLKGINGEIERILLKGGEVFKGRQKHAERAVTGGELRVKGGTECDGDAWFKGHLSRCHGCRRRLFIPTHRFGRCAVVFHLTTLEIDASLANFAEKPAGVADKQKRAPVLDERIHALAAFFLERGITD